MKRNITLGILFISAIALSSCSTQNKLATAKVEDDAYFTKAKAGDEATYTASTEPKTYRQDNYSNSPATTDDYYYYDSYEARLNRFYGYSPYGSSYFNDMYYGSYSYNPFSPFNYGVGLSLGYGMFGNYGYSPYGYSPYGYSPYGYSPYGYNPVYAYGGGGNYWGTYSYYNTTPNYGYGNIIPNRPYRGAGVPGSTVSNNGGGYTGYGSAGSYPPANRPVRTSVVGGSNNNGGTVVNQRPARTTTTQPSPQYTPQQQYTPPPQQSNTNSGSSNSSSSSSSSSNSSGGGGGRPVRP